jgi:hypothetical protein
VKDHLEESNCEKVEQIKTKIRRKLKKKKRVNLKIEGNSQEKETKLN